MYSYCRSELRDSKDPVHLLTEIGISPLLRPALVGLVDGTATFNDGVPESVVAQVNATVSGLPRWTGRLRVDPVGSPGTINIVLVKADSAALGLHGIAVQRVKLDGPGSWTRRTYVDPQSPFTRRSVMGLIGAAIQSAVDEGAGPIHLVVPDRPTADLLATAADSLAGVELSRLRWQRDLDSGRKALTFDGVEATMPTPLSIEERLAVSFLLEEDRARAMSLRNPVVDLRSILSSHLVTGGPASDAGRLDYVVRWATATLPLNHRCVSDEIAGQDETPGARLSNLASDAIFKERKIAVEGDAAAYVQLVNTALDYRIQTLAQAVGALATLADSRLREIFRTLESDAQVVWGRRLALQASDLVRFSRTYRNWRNAQVEMLDADRRCATQLTSLADTTAARESAADAGVRELATAVVLSINPLRLDVKSRRLTDGSRVVALHVNERALVETLKVAIKIQAGSFKFGQLPIGFLRTDEGLPGLRWQPLMPIELEVGDQLVLADTAWFTSFKSGHEIAVVRPAVDKKSAPTANCLPGSYAADPQGHQWCCKPHLVAEAEWADKLADRRARGELNPETWPPLIDEERFDVGPNDGEPELPAVPAPTELTIDDLD